MVKTDGDGTDVGNWAGPCGGGQESTERQFVCFATRPMTKSRIDSSAQARRTIDGKRRYPALSADVSARNDHPSANRRFVRPKATGYEGLGHQRAGSTTLPALSALPLKLSYRTGRDDLVRDFFVPCLEAAVLYRRAAGYFTSAGLALAARGVASLALRRGRMRLVVSPHLEADDIAALERAGERPAEVLRTVAARTLADVEDALIKDRLNALAWLAAAGLLEIRLAFRVDGQGRCRRGLFHPKTGVFTDEAGNQVSFTGSANETAGGLVENYEHIEAFRSWQDPEGRVAAAVADFEALWANETPGLQIIEFSQAARELLERYRDPAKPLPGLHADGVREPTAGRGLAVPPGLVLRPYQEDAIRAWSKAGGRGVFAMATGSGKTVTALVLATKVTERNQPIVILIVCPFINLCRQWIREVAAFGVQAVPCFEGRERWQSLLDEGHQRLAAGLDRVLVVVTTNATLLTEPFHARLRARVDAGSIHHLLIADEVHNLGADHARAALPDGIRLRLGLSATPERHMDPVGTAAVLGYFGDVVYEYGLAQAIADGRLCRYRYHPILVELTDEEADEYIDITKRLARFMRTDGSDDGTGLELSQPAMHLLMRRARLIGAAQNKLKALDQLLTELPEKPTKAIFYCGDGRTTDSISQEEMQQIKAVSHLLGERHGLRVRNFTFREKPQEREEILRDLASGFLDGVVAIRCLDEGIDLPDLRMAFLLASASNPRQFVQRRGRLLRNAPGKTTALFYDFIVAPLDVDQADDPSAFNLQRQMLARELTRVAEFSNTAANGLEATASLAELRKSFQLLALG
jgi:DNA phosphorothioation system restriction enzyme